MGEVALPLSKQEPWVSFQTLLSLAETPCLYQLLFPLIPSALPAPTEPRSQAEAVSPLSQPSDGL